MPREADDQRLSTKVARSIEELIRSGALRPGERVPSIRRSGRQHGVSATTVVEAYLTLENRGLIEGRPKSGFFVRARLDPKRAGRKGAPARARLVEMTTLQTRLFDAARMPDVAPFGAASPSPEVLPSEKFARITASLARRHAADCVRYDMPPGSEALRRQVAKRCLEAGTTITPDEIVTTCGGTEALALALRATTAAGDVVAVESPTYFGLLQLLEDLKLRALEIPMEPQTGMRLDVLENTLRRQRIAAVVAVPNHSNPLGSVMPDAAKQRLIAMLRAPGIPLIEDDINGELTHGAQRPKVAQAFDRDGLVLLCGSYSKTLAPGARVGWIAPGRFYDRVKALKLTSTLATASLPQIAVAEFLANGGYEHHLRGLRAHLGRQVQHFRHLIIGAFPEGTRVSAPSGGFVLWVELPPPISALQFQDRALKEKISIAPGPMFSARQQFENCLRINCGHGKSPRLDEAIGKLGLIAKRLCRA